MPELRFDYTKLPYGRGGAKSDHNRFNWRCELLLTRNVDAIKDKVVLDLACNNGRLSYPCLELGAKKVIGVEARRELIDQAEEYIEGTGLEDRIEFVHGDLFEFLASAEKNAFDTILCFGFLYHTVNQVEFFRQIQRLNPTHVIIDTSVAKNYIWYGLSAFMKKPPALFAHVENPEKTSDTTDTDGVVFWPTCSFLERMFDIINYKWERIDYDPKEIKDLSGLEVYKRGTRASYFASRKG